jgi:hypothetical protein
VADEQNDQAPRAAREVVEASLEKIRKIVHAPPRRKEDAAAVKPEFPAPPMLSDVGHGERCTCEICWQMRMLEIFPGAKVVAGRKVTAPGAKGQRASSEVALPVPPAAAEVTVTAKGEVLVRESPRTVPSEVSEAVTPGEGNPSSVAPPTVAVPVERESKLDLLKRLFPL